MRIIGIMLIKDEDIWIEKSILSIVDFCDEVIVLDNNSKDETWNILQKVKKSYPKIRMERIDNPLKSHSKLSQYVATDTWIFAVDGDEVYDRERLKRFRLKLLNGDFAKWWHLMGNCLHVTEIDYSRLRATGYMSPPSHTITKLVNFSVLKSWDEEDSERLHGNNRVFKDDFDVRNTKCELFKSVDWEHAEFRCIHLCFMRRSSLGKDKRSRLNPTENQRRFFNIYNFIRNLLIGRLSLSSYYKYKHYSLGELHEFGIDNFIK